MKFRQPFGQPHFSLQSKLVIGGVLILLVPMTIIGVATFIKSASTLEEISRLQLVQVAESLSGMIQIALEKDLNTLNIVASDPRVVRDAMLGKYANTQKKLTDLYQLRSSDFEGIAAYDPDGIIRADGVDEARIGISIAERNYYRAAKQGRTGVGPMVPSKATGAPIFGLSAPIISPDGKFLGGILGVVKAEYLVTFIAAIRLGKTGYVFLVDQEGTTIAHPDKRNILKTNIRDVAGLEVLAKAMIHQKRAAVAYSYDGVAKVAGICPVALTGWSIGATQNRDEIMGLAYANMKFFLVIGCFFILLIILAVFFFSKTISIPVQSTLITLNNAIDQAAEAFAIIGIDGKVRFANPAMAAIIDRPVADIVGKPFQPWSGHPENHTEIRTALAKGGTWSGHLKGARQNGEGYTLDLTLTPVFDRAGKLVCRLAVGRDITEELLMQEQLQQSRKMEAIGTLAGGIAHDFNNILGAIFGYTELSLQEIGSPGLLEEYLNQIMYSAKRAKELVNQILTFSRKSNMGRDPLTPKYVVEETVKLLRASLPSTIEIRTSLESPAAVLGNFSQVQQIIMNLCTNAGYEMRETGGILEITLDEVMAGDDKSHQHLELKPGRYLRLKVADTGGGIEANVRDRIFEPFFTTKPPGEGTGLGLSVVHGNVRSLGGEIMVDSEIGKGTVFTILLPTITLQPLAPGPTGHEDLPRGSERILLVDDEAAITRSIQRLMESLGYTVRVFNSSKSAWEEFSAAPDAFDAIVTDYTMPQMTGGALARKVRNLGSPIPIVLCSGNPALEEDLDGLQPIEFVRKPLTASELTHALRKVLSRSGRNEKNAPLPIRGK